MEIIIASVLSGLLGYYIRGIRDIRLIKRLRAEVEILIRKINRK